jgi:hypothetical protein
VLQAGRSPVGVSDEVNFFFQFTLSFQPHYGPGIDSASNGDEYHKIFLGVKSGRRVGLATLPPSVSRMSENVEASTSRHPKGLHGLYRENFTYFTLPCALQTWTHRRWLRPVKFAIEAFEGTVASEVGIPGLSYIPIGRSRME